MTVHLKFHGASRTVTGSCYMIETDKARVMIDCGMFQGPKTERELNYRDFPFEPQSVHALLLTHAHIDHSGLIPKLVRHGFGGPIYCTPPTVDLCGVMLPDSGHIQEMEVRMLNERNRKRGLPEVEPLYTLEDAIAALTNFKSVDYEQWLTPAKGIRARWWNAGHLLGSASIEVEVERDGGKPLRILFSGDIGPDHKMLQADPEAPTGWDCVICESTYGDVDRFERSQDKRRELMAAEVNAAAARRGVLLIPSFAVERTQEVVTDLVALMEAGLVPKTDIFIDSPLANKASAIFRKHARELEEGDALYRAFASPLVRATETVDDSKALNRLTGYHIVIAASGMAEAGRIRHHLKNNLWKPSTTVLLVGFQAAGTLGHVLESGAEMVKIMGEDIQVKATIRRFEDYSGHADGPELVQWMKERLPVRQSVFLTHGEEEPQLALQEKFGALLPADCIFRPQLDDVYDLTGERCALLVSESKPRIDPASLARPDSNNDAANLHLDIDQELRRLGDEKSRALLLRRLRRALAGDQPPQDQAGRRRMPPRFGPSRRGQRGHEAD